MFDADVRAGLRVGALAGPLVEPCDFSPKAPAKWKGPGAPGESAEIADPADALLDDPVEWPAFGRIEPRKAGALPADVVWSSHVVVSGMHCAACSVSLHDALMEVPGVLEADVVASSGRARVLWSPGQTSPSRWFAAARAAGYPLTPAGDHSLRARRKREARTILWRWMVAALCGMQVMMYAYPDYVSAPGELSDEARQLLRWASWVLILPVLCFSCAPFFRSAWADLRRRRIGMDLPVALGMAATFAVSSAATFDPGGPLGDVVYFDSLAMFVLFLLSGRWLEQRLRDRSSGLLETLANRLPEGADRIGVDGATEHVAVRRLRVGDLVQVRVGEAFPADGTLVGGDTQTDEALLTGESTPVPRRAGDPVLAGSYNVGAPVRVRICAVGADTRFASIVALMDSAMTDRPRIVQLADRVAGPFLLAVLLAAVLAAAWWWPVDPGRALMVAVAVLVVTCPCALSLAAPTALLASAGRLAQGGVLLRRLQALEALAGCDTVVFDKTGTLTTGVPQLAQVRCRDGVEPAQALRWAAALAAQSLHPVARAVVQAAPAARGGQPIERAVDVHEVQGAGIAGRLESIDRPTDGHAAALGLHLRFGSAAFCNAEVFGASGPQSHLADEQGWLASFELVETLRPDALSALDALREQGLVVRLLSGDRPVAVQALAARCGIEQAQGDCTPEAKLDALRQLQADGHRVAMVGDGLNDAPVLAQADVSFAVGDSVPLARARADFVLPGGRLQAVALSVTQARATLRVVRQNLAWAGAYNLVCVPLAVAGWLPAWLAGLGMAASSLLVVANAVRLVRPAARRPSLTAVQQSDSASSGMTPSLGIDAGRF